MNPSHNNHPTLNLLLHAAEQLIEEKGCRHTTLQDIIDRTGLSKGAIYHYVSGKDELFGLILQSKMELLNQQFQEAIHPISSPIGLQKDPFEVIALGLAEVNTKNQILNSIFIYLLSQRDHPAIATILNEQQEYTYRTVVEWIKIGQREKAIPASVDASKMANLFITFSYGLRVQKLVSPLSEKMGSKEILQLLVHSLTS